MIRTLTAALFALPLIFSSLAFAAEPLPETTETSTEAVAEEDVPATPLPDSPIYLLSRVQLTGTDLTQVVFIQDRTITTLEDCERQRAQGLTTGWQSYRHYLKTHKGVSYKVDYRCVFSNKRLSAWRTGIPLDQSYLVRAGNNNLRLTKYRNFFECRNAMERQGLKESLNTFCANSSQTYLK